jgi:hypothetical protein
MTAHTQGRRYFGTFAPLFTVLYLVLAMVIAQLAPVVANVAFIMSDIATIVTDVAAVVPNLMAFLADFPVLGGGTRHVAFP